MRVCVGEILSRCRRIGLLDKVCIDPGHEFVIGRVAALAARSAVRVVHRLLDVRTPSIEAAVRDLVGSPCGRNGNADIFRLGTVGCVGLSVLCDRVLLCARSDTAGCL